MHFDSTYVISEDGDPQTNYVTIQKIEGDKFLIYFENCIAKDFFKGIHEANGIFYVKDINNKYVHASDSFKNLVGFDDNLSELNDIKIHGEDAGQKYLKCCKEFMKSFIPFINMLYMIIVVM